MSFSTCMHSSRWKVEPVDLPLILKLALSLALACLSYYPNIFQRET